MENAIKEAKEAENFPEILEACRSAGVSFEDTIKGNFTAQKRELTIDRLYKNEQEKFMEVSMSEEWTESGLEGFETYWNNLTNTIVSDYKKTKAFVETSKKLKEEAGFISKSDDILEDVKVDHGEAAVFE